MGRGRRPLGWTAVAVGGLVTVCALVLAVLVGPDNRIESGPHGFTSAGATVATAPSALAWTDVTVEVTAAADNRAVFVGVAHDVDVADYLHGTAYTRVDSIDIPWSTETTAVSGDKEVAAPPEDVDFWLASDSGDDQATVRFPLPKSAVDVVVMDADGRLGFDPDVTVSVVENGLFVEVLAVLIVGIGVVGVGVLLLRHAPRRGRRRGSRVRGRRTSTSQPGRHAPEKSGVGS